MASDTAWTEGPTLSIWTYDTPRGAAAGTVRLHRLSQKGAVVVGDAATATWVRGAHRPRIGRPQPGTIFGPRRASPLGALLQRVVPSDGAAPNDLLELATRLGSTGLTADFLRQLRDRLVPDSSALLVLSLMADFDEVQLVIERGRARGDVRLAHVHLRSEGLAAIEGLATTDPASDG